jgi:hypothetical protein
MPALPDPRTWFAGPVKAPALRADVSGAVQWLRQPPMFTGSQQVTAQSIPDSTRTVITLDTDIWDSVNGHNPLASPGTYYCQQPGYYLAEGTAALAYTGGTGLSVAYIGFSTAGGTPAIYDGESIPNGTVYPPLPTVAKLVLMTHPGPIGSSGTDYLQLQTFQSSGGAQDVYNTPYYPLLQATWVAAPSGTAPLPVPANPPWPVPPAYVTSADLNASIRDTIRFLAYPPVMEAYYQAGAQSLASGTAIGATGTVVQLDTITYDTYAAFATSSHTWTAPVAGTYYCYGQLGMPSQATSLSFAAGLTVTSANYNSGTTVTLWEGPKSIWAGTGATSCTAVRRRLRLNAGDTVKLAGFQHDSGGNAVTLSGGAGAGSRLITVWRSA